MPVEASPTHRRGSNQPHHASSRSADIMLPLLCPHRQSIGWGCERDRGRALFANVRLLSGVEGRSVTIMRKTSSHRSRPIPAVGAPGGHPHRQDLRTIRLPPVGIGRASMECPSAVRGKGCTSASTDRPPASSDRSSLPSHPHPGQAARRRARSSPRWRQTDNDSREQWGTAPLMDPDPPRLAPPHCDIHSPAEMTLSPACRPCRNHASAVVNGNHERRTWTHQWRSRMRASTHTDQPDGDQHRPIIRVTSAGRPVADIEACVDPDAHTSALQARIGQAYRRTASSPAQNGGINRKGQPRPSRAAPSLLVYRRQTSGTTDQWNSARPSRPRHKRSMKRNSHTTSTKVPIPRSRFEAEMLARSESGPCRYPERGRRSGRSCRPVRGKP